MLLPRECSAFDLPKLDRTCEQRYASWLYQQLAVASKASIECAITGAHPPYRPASLRTRSFLRFMAAPRLPSSRSTAI